MVTEKKIPTTRVSDVAWLMADEGACPHSVWFISRHGRSGRVMENGSGYIDGNPGRTSLVRETAARLEELGDDVFLAIRNGFEATGSWSGARITGRPDIIARHVDGRVTVYDFRPGDPSAADEMQVRLAMYLLPRSNHGLWRGTRPDGCVVYTDGTERHFRADEIDEEFVEKVAVVMRQIVSDEPARYMPSARECGRCVLTADDCSERIEGGSGVPGDDSPGSRHSIC